MDSLENPRFRQYQEGLSEEALADILRQESLTLLGQQDAEMMLFKYIITSACRSDTPLDIPLGLAAYLGKVYDLSSSRILEATLPSFSEEGIQAELSDRVAKLSDVLTELAPEIKRRKAEDIVEGEGPWISVPIRDFTTARDKEKEHKDALWRPMDSTPASFKECMEQENSKKEKKSGFYRYTIYIVLILSAFFGMRIAGCSPEQIIIDKLTSKKASRNINSSEVPSLKANGTLGAETLSYDINKKAYNATAQLIESGNSTKPLSQ